MVCYFLFEHLNFSELCLSAQTILGMVYKISNKVTCCHSGQYVCRSIWRLKITAWFARPLWTTTKSYSLSKKTVTNPKSSSEINSSENVILFL